MQPTPIPRDLFPVTQQAVYFNHAAVSPLAMPTRRAMERHLEELNTQGAMGWLAWPGQIAAVRATLARLVGASPAEIALQTNTSGGLLAIALAVDWKAGDRVVGFECEFPANLYPWLALRRRGVTLDLLPEEALLDMERVRRACRGARLLAVSMVQYLSGLRVDIEALGAICRETGTLLVVDAIQAAGVVPIDVKRAGIHACAAGGQKWLTGPEGAGFLFVDEAILDQLVPAEVGWFSFADWEDFSAARRAAQSGTLPAWREGSARFEYGSPNMCGLLGLGAATEVLLGAGVEAITNHVVALGDRLAAGVQRWGGEVLRPSDHVARRSGISSFRHPRHTADEVVAHLESRRISTSSRSGWVRCSPHGYNTPDEVDQLLAILEEMA